MNSRISFLVTITCIFTACTNGGSSAPSVSRETTPGMDTTSDVDAYAGPVISDYLRNPDGTVNFSFAPSQAARICIDRGLRLPTLLELLEEAKSHGTKFDVATASPDEDCRYFRVGNKSIGYDSGFAAEFKNLIYTIDKTDPLNPRSTYESPKTCYERLLYNDERDNGMYDPNRRQYYAWTRSVSLNRVGSSYQYIAFSNQGKVASEVDVKLDFANQRFFFYNRGRQIKVGVRCVGAESL